MVESGTILLISVIVSHAGRLMRNIKGTLGKDELME